MIPASGVAGAPPPQVAPRIPPWHHARHRRLLIQCVVAALVVALVALLVRNIAANVAARGVHTGFGFLADRAGFQITPALIPFNEDSSFGRALVVGLLNTMVVTVTAIPLATVLGVLLGVGSRARGRALRLLARCYVEIIRNIPPILQLFFLYFVVFRQLPQPRQSLRLFDVIFLNNRGLSLPWPEIPWPGTSWSIPQLSGFNVQGGLTLGPELLALVATLALYQASYIAETVRSGLASVPAGQAESGQALGLTQWQILRRIILPQALDVMRPPLTTIYVNTLKGSTLAAAIAYPDLVSVFAGTVLNLTGQAIEVMLVTGAVYLILNIAISTLMQAGAWRRTARR